MRIAFVLPVLAALACATSPPTSSSSSPSPSPSLSSSQAVSQAQCASCHPREAARWATSAHARATRTPAYVESLKTARFRSWCTGCHAASGAEVGVGCVECHREHKKPSDDACARCHEFRQPRLDTRHFTLGPYLAQSTVTESNGARCASCHMRDGDHATPSLRGTGVDVALVSADDAHARFAVTVHDVAHRVPTGDPFRRIEIDVCADDACTSLAGRRVLGRVAEARPDGFAIVRDDTLAANAVVDVKLRAPAVRYRVVEKLVDDLIEPRVDASVREFVYADAAIEAP